MANESMKPSGSRLLTLLFVLTFGWGGAVVAWAFWAAPDIDGRARMAVLMAAWIPSLLVSALWLFAQLRTPPALGMWRESLCEALGVPAPAQASDDPLSLPLGGQTFIMDLEEAVQTRFDRLLKTSETFRYEAVCFTLPYEGDRCFKMMFSDRSFGGDPDGSVDDGGNIVIEGLRPPVEAARRPLRSTVRKLLETASDGIPPHENLNQVEVGEGGIRFLGEFGKVWYHPENVKRVTGGLAEVGRALQAVPVAIETRKT